MGVVLYEEPRLENPVLIASWPGIGNIGVVAVNILRGMLKAEEIGEIEPWDLFYPRRVSVRKGELKNLEFPASKFYAQRTETQDLILFIGEEQPSDGGRAYAEGTKAYRMANLVLDVAQKFECRRIYTSGAAVAAIHHTVRPRVWAVPNYERLIPEVKGYENTVVMSDIEDRGGQGNISGLNGLLLGVAKKRGVEAICVMGEIPVYLQGLPFPYPKASKSVIEVLASVLEIAIDMQAVNAVVERSEADIEGLYQTFPPQIREQLDRLKYASPPTPTEPGPITEEDKAKILEDIDKFFKKGPRED